MGGPSVRVAVRIGCEVNRTIFIFLTENTPSSAIFWLISVGGRNDCVRVTISVQPALASLTRFSSIMDRFGSRFGVSYSLVSAVIVRIRFVSIVCCADLTSCVVGLVMKSLTITVSFTISAVWLTTALLVLNMLCRQGVVYSLWTVVEVVQSIVNSGRTNYSVCRDRTRDSWFRGVLLRRVGLCIASVRSVVMVSARVITSYSVVC